MRAELELLTGFLFTCGEPNTGEYLLVRRQRNGPVTTAPVLRTVFFYDLFGWFIHQVVVVKTAVLF